MIKKTLRIILSPFIFIYYSFLIFAGLLFPTTMLIIISLIGLIKIPVFFLINKSIDDEVSLENEPFIEYSRYIFVNHLIGATVLLWFPFYFTLKYITEGEIINLE